MGRNVDLGRQDVVVGLAAGDTVAVVDGQSCSCAVEVVHWLAAVHVVPVAESSN